jgi:plastocyanin
VWTNQDEIEHTATSGAPSGNDAECEASGGKSCSSIGSFNLPLAQKGARAAFTFDKPGRHAYYCARHPFMRGEIHATLKGDSK